MPSNGVAGLLIILFMAEGKSWTRLTVQEILIFKSWHLFMMYLGNITETKIRKPWEFRLDNIPNFSNYCILKSLWIFTTDCFVVHFCLMSELLREEYKLLYLMRPRKPVC